MPQWNAGGVNFPHGPYMIGAGVCKTSASTTEWLKVAPVVSGSHTLPHRPPNKGDRLFHPDTLEEFLAMGKGFNWFGMPNVGLPAVKKELADYAGEQPLIMSFAGFSVQDYLDGVQQVSTMPNAAAIELNFGCPNTEHGKIMSFDLVTLEVLFAQLAEHEGLPIWVKFSPYQDEGLLREVAQLVNACSSIRAVVTCNTVPNQYAGEGNISSPDGKAGLSGPVIKPIALKEVSQFRHYLEDRVDVFGVGGITTGNDIMDFLDRGAVAAQATSWPFWSGTPRSFLERLLDPETASRFIEHITDDI